MPIKDRSTLFVMKSTDAAEKALKRWLGEKEFNHMSYGWTDKRGNLGIGLNLETGHYDRPTISKVAVVVCLDDSFDRAFQIIEQHLEELENDTV